MLLGEAPATLGSAEIEGLWQIAGHHADAWRFEIHDAGAREKLVRVVLGGEQGTVSYWLTLEGDVLTLAGGEPPWLDVTAGGVVG